MMNTIKVTVVFSRSYEVELPKDHPFSNEEIIDIARNDFKSEIEFLDASNDNFSAKMSINDENQ